jgi:hypothetical protein
MTTTRQAVPDKSHSEALCQDRTFPPKGSNPNFGRISSNGIFNFIANYPKLEEALKYYVI